MTNPAFVMLSLPSMMIQIQISLTENSLSTRVIQLIYLYIMCFSFHLVVRDMIGQCACATVMILEHRTISLLIYFIFIIFIYTLHIFTKNSQLYCMVGDLPNSTLLKCGSSLKTCN